MKKPLLAVVCVIALCSLLTVTLLLRPMSPTSVGTPQPTQQSSSQSTPQNSSQQTLPNGQQSPQRPMNRTLQEAVGNATNYFAQTQEPYALLNLNVLYRRFGIAEFANSLQRYDQLLLANPKNAALLRVFRRIADYNNPVQATDFDAVTEDVDKITVPALYSDRRSLPDDYLSKLKEAAKSGDYLLTHALLATIWLQENHCTLPIPDDFKQSLYNATAGLINNDSVVTDLEIEAAALLYMAGQGTLVADSFVQRVIATQNYDGGWSHSSDVPVGSYWHSSVLALMLLLHVEFPAASYPPMLAPAPSYDGVCLNPLTVCSIVLWLFALVNVRKKTKQFSLMQPNQWRFNVKQI
jgi:hypothetical protein